MSDFLPGYDAWKTTPPEGDRDAREAADAAISDTLLDILAALRDARSEWRAAYCRAARVNDTDAENDSVNCAIGALEGI